MQEPGLWRCLDFGGAGSIEVTWEGETFEVDEPDLDVDFGCPDVYSGEVRVDVG